MIIQPKIRGFICTTAHPLGCASIVAEQIRYVESRGRLVGPKRVLIIGSSTGYGLASRIVSTYGMGAKTIGVFFEKAAEGKRTASAGWYNMAVFERLAHQAGYYAKSINGDAFSNEIKQRAAALIRQDLRQVDLVIYSLASARRVHPQTGKLYTSCLKPLNHPFVGKSVDVFRAEVIDMALPAATEEEIEHTVAVMGGEDWEQWMTFLQQEGLLAPGVMTVAYSYIGSELTYPIYKEGTIGKAKEDLHHTAARLQNNLLAGSLQGKAFIAVNKAVVTQASAAIPMVPLYLALLFRVMKAKGIHEGCIEQIYRLFHDYLASDAQLATQLTPDVYMIRLDNLELRQDVQEEVKRWWPSITTENLAQVTDLAGYQHDFYRLFGFDVTGIDYCADVDPVVAIDSLEETSHAIS